MENTDVSTTETEKQVTEESKTVIDQVTEDVSKRIEETNGEVQEKTDEIVPPPTATPSSPSKPIDEQENVTEITSNIPASVSPGRANVPFKEVNETEVEESTPLVNGTENINNKKRELDQEDEQIQEKILDNDERPNDQNKKIKTSESTDIPIMEKNESENNIITNGNTAVEV